MKASLKLIISVFTILLLGLLGTLLPAGAQDYPSSQVLILQTKAALTESPIIEATADGQTIFKLHPTGTVTGSLEGTFSQRITQIIPSDTVNAINVLEPITTFFTIETEEGMIEGYYSGAFYFQEGTFPDANMQQHGQILSVTAAYADLYLAEVFFDSIVDFEEVDGAMIPLGDSGTLIIAPR
jgi:hypothetical protein